MVENVSIAHCRHNIAVAGLRATRRRGRQGVPLHTGYPLKKRDFRYAKGEGLSTHRDIDRTRDRGKAVERQTVQLPAHSTESTQPTSPSAAKL